MEASVPFVKSSRLGRRHLVTAAAVILLSGLGLERPVSAETWDQATPAVFAAGVQHPSPDARFNAVSCASAGNCTAVGYVRNAAGAYSASTMTSTNGIWADATTALFPAGVQNSIPFAEFKAVSCASAGNCTAIGTFSNAVGAYETFTMTSTNGIWGQARPTVFAAGARDVGVAPNDGFMSVSCASAGNCTAVGSVSTTSSGGVGAFTVTSTNGVWADATTAAFAAGVQRSNPFARFDSVSCVSAGNCTAVGGFTSATAGYQAFTMTSTNGVWAQATPAVFAGGVQNTTPNAGFRSVSCVSAGNCTAVGYYRPSNSASGPPGAFGSFTFPFAMTSSNGVWSQATPVTFAAGVQDMTSNTTLWSVSCASAGNCTAVGGFSNTNSLYAAYTVTSTNGVWSQATPVAFGSLAHTGSELFSVSCVAAGQCTAVGQFYNAGGWSQAFAVSSTNGVWGQVAPAAFAPGVESANQGTRFWSVSCVSAGNCTAAGDFRNAAGDFESFTMATPVTQGPTSAGTPVVLPPELPTLVNEPARTVPPSTPAPGTTNPPTTPQPPTTAAPTPVPGDDGALPALPPGASQVLEDGVPTPVEIFVEDATDLVVRNAAFQINLTGECSYRCTIATDPDGRHVLQLEQDGRARATGRGFLADTPVYVWLFSEPTLLGELTVRADGTFDGSVSLIGIDPGHHTLQLTGTSTDGTLRTANLGVSVSPQVAPAPGSDQLPSTGSNTTPIVVVALTLFGLGLVTATRRGAGAGRS